MHNKINSSSISFRLQNLQILSSNIQSTFFNHDRRIGSRYWCWFRENCINQDIRTFLYFLHTQRYYITIYTACELWVSRDIIVWLYCTRFSLFLKINTIVRDSLDSDETGRYIYASFSWHRDYFSVKTHLQLMRLVIVKGVKHSLWFYEIKIQEYYKINKSLSLMFQNVVMHQRSTIVYIGVVSRFG